MLLQTALPPRVDHANEVGLGEPRLPYPARLTQTDLERV